MCTPPVRLTVQQYQIERLRLFDSSGMWEAGNAWPNKRRFPRRSPFRDDAHELSLALDVVQEQ
jgi:hypothetical protein